MDENQSSDPRKQDQLPDSKPETSPVCSSVESPVQTIRKAAFLSKNDPNSGCKSFSQLLAGQMASPANSPAAVAFSGGPELKPTAVLTLPVDQSTYMVVPQGLITSTGIFPSGQGQFGISHQQVLANVTAQAVQAQAQKQFQAGYSPNQLEVTPSPVTSSTMSALNITPLRQLPPAVSEDSNTKSENGQLTCIESKPQLALVAVEKPSNDVYNWRKYGQKQVKGSDYPRSYYKCTHSTCTVKKMVVRSLEGHPTEIIYKGEHNHEPPPTRRVIGFSFVASGDGNESLGVKIDMAAGGNPNESDGNPIESDLFASQSEQGADPATGEHVSVSDEIEEDGKALVRVDEEHGDEPDPKRRNTDNKIVESAPPHRTAREPRIVVQTTSEVEVLYDGYRWRKYGQKIVKGNPNPRSYYKCTSMGCPVRKHVERSSSDAKSVITTYEGKHNHDIPQTKNSNHESSTVSTAVTTVRHIKAFNVVSDQNPSTIESPGTENRDGGERPQVNNPANGEHIHDHGTELDGPKNPDETQSEGEKPNADCPSGSENDRDQRMGSNSKPCKPDGESKNPNAIQDAGEKADNPTNSKHIHDQGMVLDSNSSKLDSESKNQNQIQRPLLDENHVPVSVSILNT